MIGTDGLLYEIIYLPAPSKYTHSFRQALNLQDLYHHQLA